MDPSLTALRGSGLEGNIDMTQFQVRIKKKKYLKKNNRQKKGLRRIPDLWFFTG